MRAFPARAPEDERTLRVLVTVLLCAQGYLQVFFGYVENYAFPMLVATLYLLGALRFLRGAGSIALPLAAAACAVALSYSVLVLGPSVIVLVVAGLRDRTRDQARSWLRRAFIADPGNSRALDLYGRIAFEDRDWRQALRTYLVAVTLRPDKPDYRAQLATAVDRVGGPLVAMGMLDSMLASYPDQAGLWFERAMLLRAAGRVAAADSARARALALKPELAPFGDSLPVAGR